MTELILTSFLGAVAIIFGVVAFGVLGSIIVKGVSQLLGQDAGCLTAVILLFFGLIFCLLFALNYLNTIRIS